MSTLHELEREVTYLEDQCNRVIGQLERAIALLKQLAAQDTTSDNAAQWLSGMATHIPYRGDVLCFDVETVLAEHEQQKQADEVFGPREQQS